MFEQLGKNIEGIIENLSTIIVDELDENGAEIIDLNIDQLKIGENAIDQNLPNLKDPDYAKMKKAMGSKSNGRYDLILTGDYTEAMFTEKKETELLIDTKDDKRETFESLTPFGLNEKHSEKIANEILNPVQNEISERFTSGLA